MPLALPDSICVSMLPMWYRENLMLEDPLLIVNIRTKFPSVTALSFTM